MLFAGIKKATMDMEAKKKQPEQKEEAYIVVAEDEREDMQEKTFRKWVNVHLEKANQAPISDLFKDFQRRCQTAGLTRSAHRAEIA